MICSSGRLEYRCSCLFLHNYVVASATMGTQLISLLFSGMFSSYVSEVIIVFRESLGSELIVILSWTVQIHNTTSKGWPSQSAPNSLKTHAATCYSV